MKTDLDLNSILTESLDRIGKNDLSLINNNVHLCQFLVNVGAGDGTKQSGIISCKLGNGNGDPGQLFGEGFCLLTLRLKFCLDGGKTPVKNGLVLSIGEYSLALGQQIITAISWLYVDKGAFLAEGTYGFF